VFWDDAHEQSFNWKRAGFFKGRLITAIEASDYNFDGMERHPHLPWVRMAFPFVADPVEGHEMTPKRPRPRP
jgi:hypothetical protein